MSAIPLVEVLDEVRRCQLCAPELPHSPRPVVSASSTARLLIIGQAPGARVHASGIPWDDASGDRLRDWLNLPRDTFYDVGRVAIVPMGFCYPGRGRSGDLPPRPECAPRWHRALLDGMPEVQLTLLIGRYAHGAYLPQAYSSLTAAVRDWRRHPPQYFALPHPSPRNNIWLRRNPWFDTEVLPALRHRVGECLQQSSER
ncbi:MAG: uracil-DNA glycosylase family protein [Halioglobus sp.]|nr:uracil-DNA glycosylase family protein [Halioglobus sp.]